MLPSVGIFGTDSHAQIIISLFKAAGFPVTAVWGQTLEKAKSLANELKISFYTTKIDELLLHNEVDIVCVSGTPHQYAQVCVKALSIGKHVFSSIPAGLTLKDANQMLEAAQYYPKLLSVLNHPLRFLAAFIEAKKLLSSGYCGDLIVCECSIHTTSLVKQNYDWQCDGSMGGGMLQTYGSHIIDILAFLTDKRAIEVQGTLETFTKQRDDMPMFRHISSDDFCSFQLKYPNDVQACVTLNSHLPSGFLQELMLIGKKGFLKIVNCNLYGQTKGSSEVESLYMEEYENGSLYDSFQDLVPGMYLFGLEQLIEGVKMAFESMQDSSVSADRRNADHNLISTAANFENGCHTRAVLDAIVKSHEKRAWVPVKQQNDASPPFWSVKESLLQENNKSTHLSQDLHKKSPVTNKKMK
nr:glucose-fructose oxidoreductase domain-containing protein 2 isoform X2 [Hydra vulgaris]XP_047135058.1 glucose-fructose oxidoreductase domain-containing protein 2 isoform X2 [Hydra vulgaris]